MHAMNDFFYMGGYGFYVFGAYGSVLTVLLLQWFIPWRRWHDYAHKKKS